MFQHISKALEQEGAERVGEEGIKGLDDWRGEVAWKMWLLIHFTTRNPHTRSGGPSFNTSALQRFQHLWEKQASGLFCPQTTAWFVMKNPAGSTEHILTSDIRFWYQKAILISNSHHFWIFLQNSTLFVQVKFLLRVKHTTQIPFWFMTLTWDGNLHYIVATWWLYICLHSPVAKWLYACGVDRVNQTGGNGEFLKPQVYFQGSFKQNIIRCRNEHCAIVFN